MLKLVIRQNLCIQNLDTNHPDFQVDMLAMETEAGRTANCAASLTQKEKDRYVLQ
jgi:hypothetical protein